MHTTQEGQSSMASSHQADGGAYAQPARRGHFSIDDTFEVSRWMRGEYSDNEVQHPCAPLIADYSRCQTRDINGSSRGTQGKTIYSYGGSTALFEEYFKADGVAKTEALRRAAQYDPRASNAYARLNANLSAAHQTVDEDECTRMEQMYVKCMKLAPTLPAIPVKVQVQSPQCPELVETFKVCMQENDNQTSYCSVQYRALMRGRCNLGSKLPMRYPKFTDRLIGRDAGADAMPHPATPRSHTP